MRSELVRNRGDVTKVTKEQPGTHLCSHVPCFQPLICNNSSKTEVRDRLTASLPVVRVIQTLEDESVFCVPLFPHPHLQCSYVAMWPSSLPVQHRGYVAILTCSAASWLLGHPHFQYNYAATWTPSPPMQLRGYVALILAATFCGSLMRSFSMWMTVSSLRGLRRQPGQQLLSHLVLIHSQPSMMEKWGWELGEGSEEMVFRSGGH